METKTFVDLVTLGVISFNVLFIVSLVFSLQRRGFTENKALFIGGAVCCIGIILSFLAVQIIHRTIYPMEGSELFVSMAGTPLWILLFRQLLLLYYSHEANKNKFP